MWGLIREWKFSFLLLALVANIVLVPLATEHSRITGTHLDEFLIPLAFTLLLIIMVFVVGHNIRLVIIYSLFAFVALLFSWITVDVDHVDISTYRHLFSFAALAVAMVLVIREMFNSILITMDTIAGALCAYLLMGLLFASLYAFIDTIQPGSFGSSLNPEAVVVLSTNDAFLERIYFSYITLLTVGYGDIVPLTDRAKLITLIEGFFGQVYLVVMIARLVGMHVSQRSLLR